MIDDLVARTGTTPEPYVIPTAVEEDKRGGAWAAAADQLRRVWAFNPTITAVAWSLFIAVMLVYYAALSWMPSILKAEGFGQIAAFASTTLMNALGIVGVALSVLVVDRSPQGAEHVKRMLVGNILTIGPHDVVKIVALYGAVGLLHVLLRRPLLEIGRAHV